MNIWENLNLNQSSMVNNYMLPRYEIAKVKGEAGARSFRMGPNSSYLLLDENDAIVWLVQTDGNGGLPTNVVPFSLLPYQPPKPVDLAALEQRIEKLEKRNESYNRKYGKPKKQQQQQQRPVDDAT